MRKTNTAFTLAEVLVTLGIIGVISAITVPGLKKFSEEQAIVAQVKKANSTISSVTERLITENGPVRFWNLTSVVDITNMYKNKMNATNIVQAEYPIKGINGQAYTLKTPFNSTRSFTTADGMVFFLQENLSQSGICKTGDDHYLAESCIDWGVDVNGPQPPNVIGVDVVGFYITANGEVFPEGVKYGKITPRACDTSLLGWGCTAKMLEEGKISW